MTPDPKTANQPTLDNSAVSPIHTTCSVCGHPAVESTRVIMDTAYLDDFDW